jgi:hypothetical protein
MSNHQVQIKALGSIKTKLNLKLQEKKISRDIIFIAQYQLSKETMRI